MSVLRMGELITRSVRCPLCWTAFAVERPVAAAIVGRDADLRPRFAGADPLPSLVLACSGCRYAAYPEGFEGQATGEDDDEPKLFVDLGDRPPTLTPLPRDEELTGLRRYVRSDEYAQGIASEPFGAARYVLAARCHEFRREGEQVGAADFYLKGSWCARAGGDLELERRLQREVVLRLRTALEGKRVPEADRLRALYLCAELSRRAGDFSQAVDGFEQLRVAVDQDDEEGAFWGDMGRRLYALAIVKSSVNAALLATPPDPEVE